MGRAVRALGYACAALLLAGAVLGHGMLAPADRPHGAQLRALTAAYNASGHDLFMRLLETPGNIVLSPYSVGTTMAMVYSGARRETAAEMAAVLHHRMPREAIDIANTDAIAALDGYDGRAGVQLKTANALMLFKGHANLISPNYAALLREKYRAQIFADATLDEINGWVRKQTAGKIDRIVDQIDPGEVAAIVNAIYFKAAWRSPFAKDRTADADFHLSASASVKVPTMHQTGDFALVMRPDYQAIRLPYTTAALSMIIVLPRQIDGAAALGRQLDASALADLFAALATEEEVDLVLPRFKAKYHASLKASLVEAGMRRAFDLGLADFSGMTGTRAPLALSSVEHEAFIDVTEEGTEAGAATAAFMLASAHPRFVVDRPFLFYITDDATGLILFQGRISDPRPPS